MASFLWFDKEIKFRIDLHQPTDPHTGDCVFKKEKKKNKKLDEIKKNIGDTQIEGRQDKAKAQKWWQWLRAVQDWSPMAVVQVVL